jgi:hypothetical protein
MQVTQCHLQTYSSFESELTEPIYLRMAPVNTPLMKRSSSDSLLPSSDEPFAKHQKRSYHHHHRLQKPFEYDLREAAITDESTVAHLMNQAIGRVLSDAGFCFADPVALNSLQNATEECTR